jgi:hypothetical protein
MAEEIPRDENAGTSDTDDDDDSDDDDVGSDYEQNPTMFVLSGVDTSLDEIVLEDCLTKLLSSYDISNDESGDGEEDEENFLPSIMVTLLETDYNDEQGLILFCIDRSLVVIGDETEETTSANNHNTFDEDILRRIREYVVSEEAKTGDPVWIQDASKATIEIVQEEEVQKMTEEEAYETWLKHNQADGGDNTNVVPEFLDDETNLETGGAVEE